ncbi:MAG: glycosyltransferase family 2 protein, partial [Chloroflexota bacterium]
MTISIVTCCYSPARLNDLFDLLQSVRSQQYASIETVVVVDRNVSLVAPIREYLSAAGHAGCTVLLNESGRGVSAARNLGIAHANGEIVAFVDDDAVLMPGWADATASAYESDASVIGVTGPVLPLWQGEGMSWWPREFYWLFSCTYWDWTEPREVRNGYGVNLSFRREAFERCGLFETALGVNDGGGPGWQGPGGEEPDFSVRVTASTG